MAILDLFGLGGQTPFPTNQSPVDYNNPPQPILSQPQAQPGILSRIQQGAENAGFRFDNPARRFANGLMAAASQNPAQVAMQIAQEESAARKLSLEEARARRPTLTPTGQPGIFQAVYPDGRMETVTVDAAVQAAAKIEDRKDDRLRLQFEQQGNLLDKRLGAMINIAAMKDNKTKALPASLQKVENQYEEAIDGHLSNVNAVRPIIANLTPDPNTGKAPLELGPLKNAFNSSRQFLGKSTPESLRYQELEETKTRLVNESLRLNKGTQTEGDAQRAAKELEAAWAKNDTTAARKAFERLEEINIQAAENKAKLINKQRVSQGLDPVYSGPVVTPRAGAVQPTNAAPAAAPAAAPVVAPGQTSTGVRFTIEPPKAR